jgi:chromosome segregation ATPase
MTEVSKNDQPTTLTFNEVDYNIEDLTDKAKYILSQIQDMQMQANQTRAKLDQIEVGLRGFSGLLEQELENPDPVEGEVVT